MALGVATVATLALGFPAVAAGAQPAALRPTALAAPEPDLQADLDAVMAFSPALSCLSVSIDGRSVYRRNPVMPLAPASTQKLLTATVALDQLGEDYRFETSVVAGAPAANGVVRGNLTLVGGGDPTLVTNLYRVAAGIGSGRAVTSLDTLADQVAASGIREITGAIVGDESRYDGARTVASWPARYAAQNQSGPLSALGLDDGFDLDLPEPGEDEPVRRVRSPNPALAAAAALRDRLLIRGIRIGGPPATGVGPAGGVAVAKLSSAPLDTIVGEMLADSDNQIAELLTKELGRKAGAGGTTRAGAAAIQARATALGLPTAGSRVVDGSGLDPTNRVTCDELVAALQLNGGIDSPIGVALPLAGQSGTLAGRFRGTPAQDRLRAKTGTLANVTALAGFMPLTEGGTATFAYVANGQPVDAKVLGAQDLLGAVLATYLRPCPAVRTPALVAPVAPYAAQVGALSMFPLQSVLLPGAVLPLHVFEDRYRALVERCLAEAEDFGVVLIDRGSEVGGGERRTEVGTRARIVQAEQAPDGRWGVLAVGIGRIRVDQWLPDTPYPLAAVEDWPDPDPGPDVAEALAGSTIRLRRLLALLAELGDPVPPGPVSLDDTNPSLSSYRLVGWSPLGDLDRQRLLATPDIPDRLIRLDALLDEEEQVCRARLAGT